MSSYPQAKICPSGKDVPIPPFCILLLYTPSDRTCFFLWFWFVVLTRCELSSFTWIFVGNVRDGRRMRPNAKYFHSFPSPPLPLPPFLHRKTSLNKFKSSPIKSLIPFPSKTNFHVTILTSFICKLQSFLLYQFFNFSLCTTTSASTSQMHSIEKFPEQKFPFFPSFNAIWKTPFLLMLVLISFPLLLLFQASISHGPTPVVILWLVG